MDPLVSMADSDSVVHDTGSVPVHTIVFDQQAANHLGDDAHRAIHIIKVSALKHNYQAVEEAAARQKCSVICVIKADGYGHGALASALYLADNCGADAFAVATLEEAISLRKAFEQNPPGRYSKNIASLFKSQCKTGISNNVGGEVSTVSTPDSNQSLPEVRRQSQIRIIVLGPPVGFPRCFDDYFHYGIEVMISGPEAASSLLAWIHNPTERKRTQVQKAASEAKEAALLQPKPSALLNNETTQSKRSSVTSNDDCEDLPKKPVLPHPSSTLSNVSGQGLAREVRSMLINQAVAKQQQQQQQDDPLSRVSSKNVSRYNSSENSWNSDEEKKLQSNPPVVTNNLGAIFGGIEAAAKHSRAQQQVVESCSSTVASTIFPRSASSEIFQSVPKSTRRRLRWHALVDSGMGRLGFKTEPSDQRDTVDILKELVDAEMQGQVPLEFFGMCTHMADANSNSTFTETQMGKFAGLLKRIRDANISIPTVSSDNSAALLTPNLTHFDPNVLLVQPNSDTRGYVRCGGAIYGQRPAFSELKSPSTLVAFVRHVAILQKGETVGYDRTYVAPYNVRIATLTIGFADGYPRELGNKVGKVAIRGSVFPVAGNVCMDMLMVELGPADQLDGIGAQVVVGDTAVLWGPFEDDQNDGLVRLQDIASTLKTTQSALTCGLDKVRVQRFYA